MQIEVAKAILEMHYGLTGRKIIVSDPNTQKVVDEAREVIAEAGRAEEREKHAESLRGFGYTVFAPCTPNSLIDDYREMRKLLIMIGRNTMRHGDIIAKARELLETRNIVEEPKDLPAYNTEKIADDAVKTITKDRIDKATIESPPLKVENLRIVKGALFTMRTETLNNEQRIIFSDGIAENIITFTKEGTSRVEFRPVNRAEHTPPVPSLTLDQYIRALDGQALIDQIEHTITLEHIDSVLRVKAIRDVIQMHRKRHPSNSL